MALDTGSAQPSAGLLARLRGFILEDLWHADLRPRSITAAALRLLQLAVFIAQGFVHDKLLLRASALTYVTTLSLIPLLVLMVAFVGMVGGQQTLVNLVVDQLTAVSPEARELILSRVTAIKIGSLGSIGGTILVVTTVLALRHLETTLNEIWGVHASRNWMRRFADYLAVLIVAPILTAAAISLATTMQSGPMLEQLLENELFSQLYDTGLKQLPQLLLLIAFSFLYWFFPNTSVRPLSALLGAAVAAILFSMARYAYVDLSVGSARYSMLFGSMVALPLILAWIYVCWSIVLLGAEVAFAHQNLSHYRRELRGMAPGPAEREAVGLQIAVEMARAFCSHEPARSAEMLSEALDVPVRSVRELLDSFEQAALFARSGHDDRELVYLPARPVADISVAQVMSAMRGQRRSVVLAAAGGEQARASQQAVERVLERLDHARRELGEKQSLADIVLEQRPA